VSISSNFFYNLATFVDGKTRNIPKVFELRTEEEYNLHVLALKIFFA